MSTPDQTGQRSGPISRPYAEAASHYLAAGWPAVLPLPPGAKTPPPTGFTGEHGAEADATQVQRWIAAKGTGNIALRLPGTVVGIDVDHYPGKGKTGDDTLTELEGMLGALPPTWASTARGSSEGPGQSRILWFQIPDGVKLATTAGPGIDVLQRHHRYAVAPPSLHPEGGTYAWYNQRGPMPPEMWGMGSMPGWRLFAELPQRWLDYLAEGAARSTPAPASRDAGQQLLDSVLANDRPECPETASVRLTAAERMTAVDAGSRHDTMTGLVYRAVAVGAAGHGGITGLFDALAALWDEHTGDEGRTGEFDRMVLTAAQKAATAWPQAGRSDPCQMIAGGSVPTPSLQPSRWEPMADAATLHTTLTQAPGFAPSLGQFWDLPDTDPEPAPQVESQVVEPMRLFDPDTHNETELATAIINYVYPDMRYLTDDGGWIVRRTDRWSLVEGSGAEVAKVAVLRAGRNTPRGDATAEKDSREHRRAATHRMLLSAAGQTRLAGLVVTIARDRDELRMADLDTDPEILWAGGVPWDLRASFCGEAELVPARVDPGTPHLRTARYVPALVETPLWDAYLAAVWPDAEVRSWVLRVFGQAVTGIATAALPILYGEPGRGKTATLSLLSEVLGSYAAAADPRLIGTNEPHPSAYLALKGTRLAWIDEGPRHGHAAVERLKAIAGGSQMVGGRMRGNPVTFDPTHTLCMTSNAEPSVADAGLKRRVRAIPCDGDPEAVRLARTALSAEVLAVEGPGILAQLIAAASMWLADRTVDQPPAGIAAEVERMSREQDPVLAWLDNRCTPSPPVRHGDDSIGGGTPSHDLYRDYVSYCADTGVKAASLHVWGRSLSQHGYNPWRSRAGGSSPVAHRGLALVQQVVGWNRA